MSDLVYWIIMALIVGACIALLTGTFISIRKNKKNGRPSVQRQDYDDENDYEPRRPRRQGRAEAPEKNRPEETQKKQWKIILENLDTWEKYSFIFYDSIAIGRGNNGQGFEKYLSVSEDPRVSKLHCAIVRKGDKLYLRDLESRNGTYLNGKRVDRAVVLQRDDVISLGESRFEILKILRERD